MANKRKVLSVIEKVAIIKDAESGYKNTAICKKYGLASSTVFTLLKNKESVLHAYERNITGSKRLKKCDRDDLDEVLYRWYISQKNSGLPTKYSTMRAQVQIFAVQLGYKDFSNMNAWLNRFRMRHNISLKAKEEKVIERVLRPSTCSYIEQPLSDFEIDKNQESNSDTSLLSNSNRKFRESKTNTISTSALYANDLKTNGKKIKEEPMEIIENTEMDNSLIISVAASLSENNLQQLDSIDQNDEFTTRIKKEIFETSNDSLLSPTTYRQEVAHVDCNIENEMLGVVNQENGAVNNNLLTRTQVLPLHFYAMATHCVETLQCFFESVDQNDNEAFDALRVIRQKLSNVNPNTTSSNTI